jgi:hypothetical protein
MFQQRARFNVSDENTMTTPKNAAKKKEMKARKLYHSSSNSTHIGER